MRELWIGVLEVLTEPDIENGNIRAFTSVVTWASTVSEFVGSATAVFEEYGWSVLGSANIRPIAGETGFNEEITEMIESAKQNPKACIFATFYSYPSKPS